MFRFANNLTLLLTLSLVLPDHRILLAAPTNNNYKNSNHSNSSNLTAPVKFTGDLEITAEHNILFRKLGQTAVLREIGGEQGRERVLWGVCGRVGGGMSQQHTQ